VISKRSRHPTIRHSRQEHDLVEEAGFFHFGLRSKKSNLITSPSPMLQWERSNERYQNATSERMTKMSEQKINESEMIAYIADKTGVGEAGIKYVLKHEQDFIAAAAKKPGDTIELDGDELVDYVMARKDIKLNELEVENVLDAEMAYLIDKGLAGYED
jgi:hypothetical protein